MRAILATLLLTALRLPAFADVTDNGALTIGGPGVFGAGVLKSTFNATPDTATYALEVSSGVKLASGNVQFPDGSRQFKAFRVNISSIQVPTAQETYSATTYVAVTNSTKAITVSQGNMVRISYSCNIAGTASSYIMWIKLLRSGQVVGPQHLTYEPALLSGRGLESSVRATSANVMLDGPLAAGTYNYSLMTRVGSGSLYLSPGDATVCPLILEELIL